MGVNPLSDLENAVLRHISNGEDFSSPAATNAQKALEALNQSIAKDPELSKIDRTLLAKAKKLAFEKHLLAYEALPASDHALFAERFLKDNGIHAVKRALKDVKTEIVTGARPAVSAFDRPNLKNLGGKEKLFTERNVSAGMNGAVAILAGMGAINAARQINSVDEAGQQHMNWTQVGVTLLQGAFAVGCGYLAVNALRGR